MADPKRLETLHLGLPFFGPKKPNRRGRHFRPKTYWHINDEKPSTINREFGYSPGVGGGCTHRHGNQRGLGGGVNVQQSKGRDGTKHWELA
jgi:hypothetical protein